MKVQNFFLQQVLLTFGLSLSVCDPRIWPFVTFLYNQAVTEENQFTSAPSVTQGGKSSVPE